MYSPNVIRAKAAKDLLGASAHRRLLDRLGKSGEKRLLDRWQVLEKREGFIIKGIYTLGLQGAILRVENKRGPGILKICTLENIFSSQDAALRSAPVGSVPEIFQRFPKEEAWFMEEVEGSSGRRGYFSFEKGHDALHAFQKGAPKEGLFPLLPYHLGIAKKIRCQPILDREKEIVAIDKRLEKGLVHGDPMPENIIISETGKTTLIDPIGLLGDPAFDWAILALYSKDPIDSLKKASRIYPASRIYLWAWLRTELSLRQQKLEGPSGETEKLLPLLSSLRSLAWPKQ